ncbi:MAG: lamin tail domain-containing protein [Clostridiales bacterium]|nr:lamin tail domain-containing protein [Clostridiales bacterium]
MDNEPNMQGRRTASRATKLRRRKARMNFILLAGLIALIVLLVLVTPKDPLRRATYSNATESGLVEDSGDEVLGAYAGLVISEVMPSNSTAVTDEDGKYADWIEIWNSTDKPINLNGLGLSDKSDRVRFLFPNVSLEADGRVVVFCDNTNLSNPNRAFHAKFKLSSVGETIYLYDPNAYLIDSCKYTMMASDESWALVDGEYVSMTAYSPGYENSEEGHRKYRESISVSDGSVVINEIMADPITGIRDEDDELCDWVELYNTTDREISLAGLGLSDNEGKPLKWRFPDNAVIPAKGYYIVLCTGKDRMDRVKNAPHSNFKISAEKETIVLADSQGHVLDRVMIDNLPLDCSWGRNDAGQMQVFKIPTPSLPNNQSGFSQMDVNLRAMNKTRVFISEVMASNNSITTYPKSENTDWIELYNSGSESVDVSDWGLSDKLDRGRRWQFPQGTVIGPSEYKVIQCDGLTDKNNVKEPHASFKIGKLKQETITLTDPTGRVLDKMILPEMRTDVSYGRTLGIAGLFYYDTPTPFQDNRDGFTGYAEKPGFSVEPGLYYSTTYVEINIPEGTQVFYTTDCTTPTQNSNPYHGERLELNFTTVIRARAFSTGAVKPSDVLTGTFFINANHTLPVVSVVTEPDNLWNKETGMLVTGDNVVKEPGKLPFKGTVYRKVKDSGVKSECYVEMYDDSGTNLISQGACFSLMGDFSLDMPQKSFKFRAKSIYGAKTFAAKLFPDRDYTEYKSFVLRNSGNDSMFTRLQDGFQSRLMDYCDSTVAHQAWKPYAVYLNGIYWGHMNLRERTDRFMLAQFEGLGLDAADSITLLQGNGRIKYGSNREYKAMIKKIKAGNPAKNQEDLQYILDNVDVDNLFEYIGFEMFFGNSDIGNTRFYRFKTEGSKWKWVLYDVDYGLYNSKFKSPWSFTKEKGMGEKGIDNTILRKLLSVPEYKDRYLTIYGKIFQKLTTKAMLDILEELVELIKPEMQLHWARWGEENDKYVISDVPTTVDGAYRYWEQRVERLRNVIRCRPTRLWEFTQDAFNLTNAEMVKYFGEKPEFPPEAIP